MRERWAITRFAVQRFSIVALVGFGLLLASVLGASAQPETKARVTGTAGDGLILRAEASRDSEMLGLEPEGSVVSVIGTAQTAGGRSWLPVRDAQGRVGWLASEYLASESAAVPTPTSPPRIASVDLSPPAEPTLAPIPKLADIEVGPPLTLDVRFKLPELDRRDRQVIFVNVSRNSMPVQDVIVRFTVEDEDPEVEREASPSDANGRSVHEWSMRKYRGTTTVHVMAVAPDGGTGKASRSFFVK
ncbi:MAG TPA: SH3 domain-containing protein [Chloroflexota bacterium]|nr:SH3 domain-containing protein [Chloroflexota bacterium]